MGLIEQSHKIWGRCPSYPKEAIKWIEQAGRVCYNSEDKITEDSAEPFVRKLIERGHLSVLEHSEICIKQFTMPLDSPFVSVDYSYRLQSEYAVGNLRAIMEDCLAGSSEYDDFLTAWLEGKFEPVHEYVRKDFRRYTVEFTTNRAMTHELVRHRLASFSQESQRYVRYDNMKFIKPVGFDGWKDRTKNHFLTHLRIVEEEYKELLSDGLCPQQARNILPNATAARIIVTADRQHWEHIFKLRCGGGADPQIQALMNPVKMEMETLWNSEEK